MEKVTINSLYEELRHDFPHNDYLKNRLIFRVGQIFKEHRLLSEQRVLSLNGGGDYLLHEVSINVLMKGIGNFLENELLLEKSEYLDTLQKGIGKKIADILHIKNELDT